jgi:hypothetical protein
MPPGEDLPEDADERYRRASALETSRPSESTRAAILGYAERVADERAHTYHAASATAAPPAARPRLIWRRATTFGALAVAALAGLTLLTRWPAVPLTSPIPHPPVTNEPSQADFVTAQPRTPAPPAQSPAPAPAPMLSRRAAAEDRDHGASYRALAEASRVPAPLAATPGKAESALVRSAAQSSRQSAMRAAPAAGVPASGADQAAQLRAAAAQGDIATLRMLLGTHVALDAPDPHGQTALMQAVRHGQVAATETLLAAGADPNVADNEGVRPLAAAQAATQASIAELLRRYGAR